jgi:sulfopyruvate decarboxylase TPP-binding subunit
MYQFLTNEPTLDLVPVCREGEIMAIVAGLWVGGKRPIVLIQNTGIDEALTAEGPVFVHLLVEPQIENTPVQSRTPAKRNIHSAIADMPETLGIKS